MALMVGTYVFIGMCIAGSLSGCTIIWLEDMFYASAFKKIEFDEIVKDANSITIRMYHGQPQEIDAKTPYGFLTTKNKGLEKNETSTISPK